MSISRRTLISLVAVGALALAPALAITGGEPDGGRHPNVAAIAVQLTQTIFGPYAPLCTGTLIAPDVVLTAAHCVQSLEFHAGIGDLVKVFVTFDEVYAIDPFHPDISNWVPVKSWHADPDYHLVGANPHNDLGVLILNLASKPPQVVLPEPARLPTVGLLDVLDAHGGLAGETFTAVGYGLGLRTSSPGQSPPRFSLQLRRNLAESRYEALHEDQISFLQNIQAGYSGICFGDSGGPYFYAVDGEDILVGVIDLVDPNCIALGGGQRLDTEEARAFLGAFMILP